MKKTLLVITLAMVAALTLCLAGCSNSSSINASDAVELDWGKVQKEYFDNEARAKQEWDGKIVKWKTKVESIEATYSTSYAKCANKELGGYASNTIEVWFSNDDDAVKLNKGDTITVIGRLKLSSFPKIEDAILG